MKYMSLSIVVFSMSAFAFACSLTDHPEAALKRRMRLALLNKIVTTETNLELKSIVEDQVPLSSFTRPRVSVLFDPGPRCEDLRGVFHTSGFQFRVNLTEGSCRIRGTANLMGHNLYSNIKVDYEVACVGNPVGPTSSIVGEWSYVSAGTPFISRFQILPNERYINVSGPGLPSLSAPLHREGNNYRSVIRLTSQNRTVTLVLTKVGDSVRLTWTDMKQTSGGAISSTGMGMYRK